MTRKDADPSFRAIWDQGIREFPDITVLDFLGYCIVKKILIRICLYRTFITRFKGVSVSTTTL